MPEGEVVRCDLRYSKSSFKRSLDTATKKGYFRRLGAGVYKRTSKEKVHGDSNQKPIHYSLSDDEKAAKEETRSRRMPKVQKQG